MAAVMLQPGSSSCLQDACPTCVRRWPEGLLTRVRVQPLRMLHFSNTKGLQQRFLQSSGRLLASAVAAVDACAYACSRVRTHWSLASTATPWHVLHAVLQARVKEQETQKKLFNIKRVVCIGGGVALVLVAWALLVASSGRNRVDPGRNICCLSHYVCY
jgi:hypothetical protein